MEAVARSLVDEYLDDDSDAYNSLLSYSNQEDTAVFFIDAGCIDVIIKAMDKYKNCKEEHLKTRHLYSLYALFNLSKWESTRVSLKNNHSLLPALEKMMKHSSQMVSLMANFTVCLVVGRDEAGVGNDLIKRSPQIISQTIDLLNLVLDTPGGVVYDAAWDPDEIVIVILSLSVSDANKPLLEPSIPVLIKSLKAMPRNEQMVSDVVQTLLQLSFEPKTQKILCERAKEVEQNLSKCSKSPGVQNAITSLLSRLKPQERKQSTSTRGSVLAGLFRSATALSKEQGAQQKKQPQVMISYNWKHQHVIKKVHAHLVSQGIKIWVDFEQMSGNIADKMAEAVEGSDVVLMCISSQYKESGNCRQEAEYALECKKPIIVLMMEKGYKANGWLGLMVGRKLWVDCTDESAPDIQGVSREISAIFGSASSGTPPPPSSQSGGSHGKDLSASSTPAPSQGGLEVQVNRVSNESLKKIRSMSVDDVINWLKQTGFTNQTSYFKKEKINGKSLVGLYSSISKGGLESSIKILESRLGLTSLGEACAFIDELATLHSN